MCMLDLFVFKHINFLSQKLEIVIVFSPIIAQYRAPFNTSPSEQEGLVLNGIRRSWKRTYEAMSEINKNYFNGILINFVII